MQAELASFVGHSTDITQAAWHPLQEDLFVSGGHDGSMAFWLAGRNKMLSKVPAAHEGSIWTFAWNPAGHLLTTGAADTCTKFWCRARPSDPFFEHQRAAQAEMEGDMGVAEKPPIKQASMAPPSQPQAIPGIGSTTQPPPPPSNPIVSAQRLQTRIQHGKHAALPVRGRGSVASRGRGIRRGGVQKKKGGTVPSTRHHQ